MNRGLEGVDGRIERTQYPPEPEFYGTLPQIGLNIIADDRNLPVRFLVIGEIKAGDHELEERPGRLSDNNRPNVCCGF